MARAVVMVKGKQGELFARVPVRAHTRQTEHGPVFVPAHIRTEHKAAPEPREPTHADHAPPPQGQTRATAAEHGGAPPIIRTVRVEKLAHREDGRIVEYGEPYPCDVCGKLCTTKVHHMSDGAKVGKDCATIIELMSQRANLSGAPDTEGSARFMRANDKQVRYLINAGIITPGDDRKPFEREMLSTHPLSLEEANELIKKNPDQGWKASAHKVIGSPTKFHVGRTRAVVAAPPPPPPLNEVERKTSNGRTGALLTDRGGRTWVLEHGPETDRGRSTFTSETAARNALRDYLESGYRPARMAKGKAMPIGHVSMHGDGTRWRKSAPGEWEEIEPHPESPAGGDRRKAAVSYALEAAKGAHEKLSGALAAWVHQGTGWAKRDLIETYEKLSPADKSALEVETHQAIQREHGSDYVTVYRSMRAGDSPGDMGGMSVTTDRNSRPKNGEVVRAFRVHHKDVMLHWSQSSHLQSASHGDEREIILKPDAEPQPIDTMAKASRALPLDPPRKRPEEPDHPFAGSLAFQGLTLDIETPAGGVRRGTSPEGEAWSVTLPCHYGEIRGTKAVDGDAVDVFVGPDPFAPFAWAVQAKKPGTKVFDEPKLMLGFASRDDALSAFRSAYSIPGFVLGVVRWPMPALLAALEHAHIQSGRFGKRALFEVMRDC